MMSDEAHAMSMTSSRHICSNVHTYINTYLAGTHGRQGQNNIVLLYFSQNDVRCTPLVELLSSDVMADIISMSDDVMLD